MVAEAFFELGSFQIIIRKVATIQGSLKLLRIIHLLESFFQLPAYVLRETPGTHGNEAQGWGVLAPQIFQHGNVEIARVPFTRIVEEQHPEYPLFHIDNMLSGPCGEIGMPPDQGGVGLRTTLIRHMLKSQSLAHGQKLNRQVLLGENARRSLAKSRIRSGVGDELIDPLEGGIIHHAQASDVTAILAEQGEILQRIIGKSQ